MTPGSRARPRAASSESCASSLIAVAVLRGVECDGNLAAPQTPTSRQPNLSWSSRSEPKRCWKDGAAARRGISSNGNPRLDWRSVRDEQKKPFAVLAKHGEGHNGVPKGIRTPVGGVKSRCPGPTRRWGRRLRLSAHPRERRSLSRRRTLSRYTHGGVGSTLREREIKPW